MERVKKAAGQQGDNSAPAEPAQRALPDNTRAFIKPGVGAVRNIGHPPAVSADATIGVPGAGRIVIEGQVVGVAVMPAPTSAGRKLQVRQLRAHMRSNLLSSRDLEELWAPVLDVIEGSWDNRGPEPKKLNAAIKYIDEERANWSDPGTPVPLDIVDDAAEAAQYKNVERLKRELRARGYQLERRRGRN